MPSEPSPLLSGGEGSGVGGAKPSPATGDRLIGITLALEEALGREAWDEADDLFAARDALLVDLPAYAVPREVDDIDARILASLQRGQAEIRRQTLALTDGRRAVVAYAGASSPAYAQAA